MVKTVLNFIEQELNIYKLTNEKTYDLTFKFILNYIRLSYQFKN